MREGCCGQVSKKRRGNNCKIMTKNERSVKNKLSVKFKTGSAASISSLSSNINESDFNNQPNLKIKAIILKNLNSKMLLN